MNCAPNPSHLETVGAVVEGIVRAKQDDKYPDNPSQVRPIVVHGDAAIAGQGIVYEIIQMAQLEGYKTNGTIHIVVNNQIGFTTNYLDARSSTYCTDVGKVTLSPVLHVNADDVEAVVHAVLFALILFNLTHVNTALTTYNAKPVDGIIGADILKRGKAIIDYDKKYLYLKL